MFIRQNGFGLLQAKLIVFPFQLINICLDGMDHHPQKQLGKIVLSLLYPEITF